MNYLAMKKRALGGGWWADPSCVAAFRFKGARSEAEALHDMTGAGHDLTAYGSPVWSASDGYRLSIKGKYLNNAALNALDIKTVVVRYADMDRSGAIVNFSNFYGPSGVAMACGVLDFQYFSNGEWKNGEDNNYPAFVTALTNTSITYRRSVTINPLPADGGVFAASASELRLDGEVLESGTYTKGFDSGMIRMENGQASVGAGEPESLRSVAPVSILAIAFYTAELSDMAHSVVVTNMQRF